MSITLPQIKEWLSELLLDSSVMELSSDSIEILDLESNSSKVKPGSLFVAVKGVTSDGNDYLDSVVKNGASGIITSRDIFSIKSKFPEFNGFILQVSDDRASVSRLASKWFSDPTKDLFTVGITGTNGKTTTHWMIYSLFNLLNIKACRVGTLGFAYGSRESEGSLTTPDPITLHGFFSDAIANGVNVVSMECSSHALHQKRIDDILYDVSVFTNLTRDHLDYHGSMEHYAESKAHLFKLLAECQNKFNEKKGIAVINLDDEYSNFFLDKINDKKLKLFTYSSIPKNASFDSQKHFPRSLIHLSYKIISSSINSTDVEILVEDFNSPQENKFLVNAPFIAEFNIQNLLCAILSVHAYGISFEQIFNVISSIPQVPGRLESCGNDKIGVFVDYAHTPDALGKSLLALRSIAKGNLYCLFGCGGDRDKGKRPQMMSAAISVADEVIVTSDNPRTEDSKLIIDDILLGAKKLPVLVEPDRAVAIEKSLQLLKAGDILLIAGKGHENYQIIGSEKLPFSDVIEVKKFFRH